MSHSDSEHPVDIALNRCLARIATPQLKLEQDKYHLDYRANMISRFCQDQSGPCPDQWSFFSMIRASVLARNTACGGGSATTLQDLVLFNFFRYSRASVRSLGVPVAMGKENAERSYRHKNAGVSEFAGQFSNVPLRSCNRSPSL